MINFLWQPKFTTSTSMLAKHFVNGWNLSAITTLASAHPVTPTVSVSGAQFTGVSFAQTTTLNGSGGFNRVPFLPIGYLDVDRIYRVDARLGRDIVFSERVKAILMFEAFNAFNTQYNTAVNMQMYTATLGVLRPVVANGVSHVGDGTQSQGFPDGTNARRMQAGLRFVF